MPRRIGVGRAREVRRGTETDQAIGEQFQRLAHHEESTTNGGPATAAATVLAIAAEEVAYLPLEAIHIVPGFNVRGPVTEDDATLDEIQATMDRYGLIHPIAVEPSDTPGHYRLICGERRLTAARLLGWDTIMAHIFIGLSEVDKQALNLAENVQREDLEVLKEAEGYERLKSQGMSNKAIAARVGKKPPYIISLLKLVEYPQLESLIRQGVMSARMGREVARLVTPEGDERLPGAFDWMVQRIVAEHPTIARANQMVTEALETGVMVPPPRPATERPVRRVSPAEREWLRWETQLRPTIARQSRAEIRELYETLLRMAEETQSLLVDESGVGESHAVAAKRSAEDAPPPGTDVIERKEPQDAPSYSPSRTV